MAETTNEKLIARMEKFGRLVEFGIDVQLKAMEFYANVLNDTGDKYGEVEKQHVRNKLKDVIEATEKAATRLDLYEGRATSRVETVECKLTDEDVLKRLNEKKAGGTAIDTGG